MKREEGGRKELVEANPKRVARWSKLMSFSVFSVIVKMNFFLKKKVRKIAWVL